MHQLSLAKVLAQPCAC